MDLTDSGKLSKTHEWFYLRLWKYVNFKTHCTRSLLKKDVAKKLKISENRLEVLLKDLETHGFIERIYEKGQKRSKYIKVRFLLKA